MGDAKPNKEYLLELANYLYARYEADKKTKSNNTKSVGVTDDKKGK